MKVNQLLLLLAGLALLATACNTGKPVDDYQLVWSDEFDYSGRVKGIDEEAFPQVMELEYVRVFQKRNQAVD